MFGVTNRSIARRPASSFRWLLIAVLLLLVACPGDKPRRALSSPSPSPSPRPLRIVEEKTFPAEDPTVDSLVAWGHYVAWAGGDGGKARRNRIVVYDLDSGRRRVIARASTKAARTDGVQGSGETVVYYELAREPNEVVERGTAVPWVIYGFDLKSGSRFRILSDRNDRANEQPTWPYPSIDGDWIVESLDEPPSDTLDRMGSIYVYDVKKRAGRVVAKGVRGLGLVDVDSGLVVYEAASAAGTDAFAMPADGSGPPILLTTSGDVSYLEAANGALTWAGKRADPTQPGSEPHWWLPMHGNGSATLFVTGSLSTYPGTGFVVWASDFNAPKLLVRDPLGSETPAVAEMESLDLSARWVAVGERIVWATGAEGSLVIHVARVERS